MVVLFISCAVVPKSNTPLTHIPLRAILGVLQIGIRAEAIENQVKNVLLDYNHGDGSYQEHEARLNIISCAKMLKYMLKGCQVFLAHVTTKEAEGKSEKKRLENVPIVRDFPEVFPEDLPGLPLTRQVVFEIDLIPDVAPVAPAPYRLAPPKMKELSEQLKELSDKGFI
nr:putative reverse transcriptase domain-containing protein [Tanacetum cinerariifolium]